MSQRTMLDFLNSTLFKFFTDSEVKKYLYRAIGGFFISKSEKGAANGVATLDGNQKIPADQLPNSIVEYLGLWYPSINDPSLADGDGNAGDTYRVADTKSGTISGLNDPSMVDFLPGQYILYSGEVWQKSVSTGIPLSYLDTDGTLSANSDTKVASQKATKTYVTGLGYLTTSSASSTYLPFTGGTLTGAVISSVNGATGAPALRFTGNLATSTYDKPLFAIETNGSSGSWGADGTVIGVNIANNIGSDTSRLIDLQYNGSSIFNVRRDGVLTGTASIQAGASGSAPSSQIRWNNRTALRGDNNGELSVWTNDGNSSGNIGLYNVGSGNSAVSNYERIRLFWLNNTAFLGTSAAGTGVLRNFNITSGGATAMSVSANTPGGGTGFTFNATLVNISLNTVTLSAGGSGYTANLSNVPFPVISNGSGSGAIVNITTNGSGVVTGVSLVSGGTGYTATTGYTIGIPSVSFSSYGTATAASINFGTANTGIYGDSTNIRFSSNGANYAIINSSGLTMINSSIFIPIGASFNWSSGSRIGSNVNGNIAFYNNATTDFGLLQFGGTTSSFPALKRSGSTIMVRTADDTLAANIDCNSVVSNSIYNRTNSNNSLLTFSNNGLIASRNIADANTALIINQANVSSTGNILDCQFNGSSKFSVTSSGITVPQGSLSATSINGGTATTGIYFPNSSSMYLTTSGLAQLQLSNSSFTLSCTRTVIGNGWSTSNNGLSNYNLLLNPTNTAISGTYYNAIIASDVSGQTSTAGSTQLFISPKITGSTGSGTNYLIDAGTNSLGNALGTHTSVFNVTNSGAITISHNATTSTPSSVNASSAILVNGTWYTGSGGGTTTTTKPHLLIEPSGTTSNNWNTNGTGLGINSTSGFAGDFINCQKGGILQFGVISGSRTYINGVPTVPAQLALGNASLFGTGANFSTSGFGIQQMSNTYISTTSSGTITTTGVNTFAQPTLAANNATTLTNAATWYIANAPAAGSNVTITNPYALYTANGANYFGFTNTSLVFDQLNSTSAIIKESGNNNLFLQAYSLSFRTNGTTLKMYLDENGNFGLGSINPLTSMFSINNTTFSNSAAFSTSGFGIKQVACTYTSTTSSGTISIAGVNTFAIPTLAASNATTLSNASTFYIAGIPIAGSNVTISNGYSIHVASGLSLFEGGIATVPGIPGGVATSTFTAAGGSSANTTGQVNAQISGSSVVAFRGLFNGSTSVNLTANNSYGNVIIGKSPVTAASTGTHAILANLAVNSIGTVTNTNSTPITNTASLYIDGAGSGGTNNYALLVNSGVSAFGGNILPTVTNSYSIGTNANRFSNLWTNAGYVGSLITFQISDDGSNDITLRTNNTEKFKLFRSSGNIIIQNGGTFIDNATDRLQVNGSAQMVGQVTKIQRLSGNTNIDNTHSTVLGNASGGTITLTLPSTGITDGRIFRFKKEDVSANKVTLLFLGGIDGSSTYDLANQYQAVTIQYFASAYYVISNYNP